MPRSPLLLSFAGPGTRPGPRQAHLSCDADAGERPPPPDRRIHPRSRDRLHRAGAQRRDPAVPRHPGPPPPARRTPLVTGQVLGRGFCSPGGMLAGERSPFPGRTLQRVPSMGWQMRNARSFPGRRARGPSHPRHGLVILGTVWGWQLVPGWVTAEHGFHLGSARPLLAHLFPTL